MASLREAASRLERIAQNTGEAAQKAIAEALRRLERDLALALGTKAEWRYDDLAEALARVEGVLAESGLDDIASQVLQVAQDMADEVGALEAVKFTQADANMLKQAVEAKYRAYIEGVRGNPLDFIRNRLIGQTVSPVPVKALVDALAEHVAGQYQQYLFTWVNTALNKQVEDTWLVAGRSINEARGTDLWEYAGPDDKRTRPYCLHALADNPYSREEIEQLLAGTNPRNGETDERWNCRHYGRPYVSV